MRRGRRCLCASRRELEKDTRTRTLGNITDHVQPCIEPFKPEKVSRGDDLFMQIRELGIRLPEEHY
jgi:hypothetical protein